MEASRSPQTRRFWFARFVPLSSLFHVLCALATAQGASTAGGAIARGKYIVEQVSMCVHCHTPRDGNGELILSRYLRGAPVPVNAPPYPAIKWALKAPAIAGLPGYTREEGVRLLMEGIAASGARPAAPMPPFRLNRADAEAVVAYLQSLE
jgi:mono/diheme cytochrome c family protein